MSSFRQYALVWLDADGCYTARAVDGQPCAATDATAAAAVGQLQSYLTWLHDREPWTRAPDLVDPQLVVVKTSIRPAMADSKGHQILFAPLPLKLPTVRGRRRNGDPVWCVPALDACFTCTHDARGESLLVDLVRAKLNSLPAAALRPLLLPVECKLHDFHVRTPNKWKDPEPELPALRAVAESLGDRAARRGLSRAWRRQAELEALIARLKRDRASLLLVGPRGVGKTCLLADAVRRMERETRAEDEADDIDHPEFRRRFWQSSGSRLIAGMRYLGQWEERLEEVINELHEIGGVLCCENLLELATIGGSNPEGSVGAFCTPFLEQAELRMIAEATSEELDACRRILPRLTDCFQIMHVEEFSDPDARAVLRIAAESRAKQASLDFDPLIAPQIHRFFKRFLPYDAFPGGAVAFVHQVFDHAKQNKIARVDADEVLSRFIDHTGLPELFLRDPWTLSWDEAVAGFQEKIIGQPDGVEAAAQLLTTIKAGLNDPRRPLGVLLFCGPTGVGKTELAKQIAKQLFGAGREPEKRLIRLDMSEYAGFDAADRLTTDAKGQPSELVRRIREQPFSVLLLDEIEKASLEVFNALLGVFDEGRLTDRLGRAAIFRSAVVIMTSNLGVRRQTPIGYEAEVSTIYERDIRTFFRPEFFNRIDRIVTFQTLTQQHMRRITEKELKDLRYREGMSHRAVDLTWTAEVVDLLVEQGFDARYRARPLQRTLERLVVAPLARWLVRHPDQQQPRLRLSRNASEVLIESAHPEQEAS